MTTSTLPGAVSPMSSPQRFLVRMLMFLVIVALVVVLLIEPLIGIFMANPALNGLIIGALVIGIAISIRQVLALRPEVAWINRFRPTDSGLALQDAPRLLAPMAAMMSDRKGKVSLSATSMRTLLDGIETRLVEDREISKYMTGLLVFLGLLGTFWGLLETVSSVGDTIKSLTATSDDFTELFTQLQTGLEAPLSGMGLAFSSSLLGLAGSLVLGFLDLTAGQAQNRFYNDLEEWLSGFTKLSSGGGIAGGDVDGGSVPAYVAALLEQTAESLDKLQRTMAKDEDSRRATDQALNRLSEQLGLLGDRIATQQTDPTVATHLRAIDGNTTKIVEDMERGRDAMIQEMRSEIKLLARTIANVADTRR